MIPICQAACAQWYKDVTILLGVINCSMRGFKTTGEYFHLVLQLDQNFMVIRSSLALTRDFTTVS